MPEKTLVCVLAQTRAHRLTWSSFEKNLLAELNADLAVCVGVDAEYDYSNPYFGNARFRWLLPEPGDYAAEIERVRLALGCDEGWQELLTLGGTFLGGVHGMPGAGGLLYVYRWFLRNCLILEGMLERYDRFVITRSDLLFVAPHPPLEALQPQFVWLPNGEDWGGLVDRHAVLDKRDVVASLSTLSDLLRHTRDWLNILYDRDEGDRNIEYVLKMYFSRAGLLQRVRRFPYLMFLIRGDDDPTRSKAGDLDDELGFYVKYPTEFAAAKSARDRFRSRDDWIAWARRHPEGEPPLAEPEAEKVASPARVAARRLPSARRLHWLANNGKAADAVRLLDGVDLDGKMDADLLYIAGVCLGTVGREPTAIDLLRRAAEGGFDGFWCAYHLGLFEMRLGRFPQAAFYLAIALILNPDRTDIIPLVAEVAGNVEVGLLSRSTAELAGYAGGTALDHARSALAAGQPNAAAFYFAIGSVFDNSDGEARRTLTEIAPGVTFAVVARPRA